MTNREEILALADRIDALPAYSDREIPLDHHPGHKDVTVILINARWRETLAAALRAHVERK